MWFVAINDIVLLNGFGDLDTDNEWCFIDNNLLGQYSLLSQNLQKYIPCKEDCILVCLKENVFLLVSEITEAWRAGHEPVGECGLLQLMTLRY